MRKPLVAGNWKMHGSGSRAGELAAEIAGNLGNSAADVVLFPVMLHLAALVKASADSALQWGAQNVCRYAGEGAYTGEVAAEMLVDAGCRWTLAGHSERRSLFGETDDAVADKTVAALAAGLSPVVCVGETEQERDSGQTDSVIARQLDAVLDRLTPEQLRQLTIAYEPVWAIGTGNTATPEQAQAVHAAIRARIAQRDADSAQAIRIVYGGSVKASSAAALFAQADIDGGLVGGASLDAAEFAAIVAAAAS